MFIADKGLKAITFFEIDLIEKEELLPSLG